MIKFTCKKKNTLLKCLSEETLLPFSVINKKLREKQVLVNNERTKENITVNAGDEVVIFASVVEKTFETLYEDENVLIIIKPSGIESAGANSAEDILSKKYKNIKACHRLDRNTEGLVIYAKNEKAYNELTNAFKEDLIKKEYLANVFGKPKKEETLSAYLTKNSEAATVMVFNESVKNSSKIITRYKLVSSNGEISTLRVYLDFGGKTHQIRAHLAFAKLPLVGDGKYGNAELNKKYKQKTQLLYAVKLVFNLKTSLSYLNNIQLEYSPKLKY